MDVEQEISMSTASTSTTQKEVVESGKRCDYIIASATTELQSDTEDECAPFFVNFSKDLSPNEIQHLRNVGLLPANDAILDEWSSPKLEQILGSTRPASTGEEDGNLDVCLLKEKHVEYLTRALHTFGNNKKKLSQSYVSLDASRPWIMYWTLHSLDLLNALPSIQPEIFNGIVSTLSHCWQETTIHLPSSSSSIPSFIQQNLTQSKDNDDMYMGGGFGGGPGQMAHCATTYASILALCIIAGCSDINKQAAKQAQDLLHEKRWKIYVWFRMLKDPKSGAFHMHEDGEMDVRAAYIVTCISTLLNIHEYEMLLDESVMNYISDCQTYEGGFGGEPNVEAHGGYTYCALAALQLLQRQSSLHTIINTSALHGWLLRRQMSFEGGFSGRANKLVDGCYSFWQGASLAILDTANHYKGQDWTWNTTTTNNDMSSSSSWNEGMLQRYILLCAQDIHGGLRDKPSKPRDFYHSCYNLSGLSASQLSSSSSSFGHEKYSKVAPTHLLFNICNSRVAIIHQLFHTSPPKN